MKMFLFKIVLVFFFFSFLLSACVKSDSLNGTKQDKVTDLKIPAGFDWKTSVDIRCDFTSQHDSRIYVALSPKAAPFASFMVGEGVDQVTLNVPAAAKTLYVQYETENGLSAMQELPLLEGVVSYRVPADSKECIAGVTAIPGSTDEKPNADRKDNVIYYPANGWGTLMFEDLWPEYGDYDLNDLVANFKVQLYIDKKNKVEAILVGVRINAVGGIFPYEFYLHLMGVKSTDIDEIVPYNSVNASPSCDFVAVKPANGDDALFLFKEVKNNANCPAGGQYLNTEPGYEMAEKDLVEVAYMLYLKDPLPLNKVLYDSFDFFIGNSSVRKEIHINGYKPVLFDQVTYVKYRNESSNTDKSNDFYTSNTHLIWGIKVPAAIPHAYEKVEFTLAYPNFAAWAQSGGKQCQNWYENTGNNRVSSKLIP
ncbi:LruC domain-containing protein [Odoribacter laneus]|uniref:DUF4842 domain-containing protein n=1 Tax=Odoribacter laneus YIT 12061 TaxID=742817 RepID=H1DKY3_9BACT|nr:LruC domain-containing protein [Odoribacter laneus]EHP45278.1 hypothetical protein HMPREF9449_02919 [Odoribacter laneus YIT 12061]